jgi:precorrin-6A synthase
MRFSVNIASKSVLKMTRFGTAFNDVTFRTHFAGFRTAQHASNSCEKRPFSAEKCGNHGEIRVKHLYIIGIGTGNPEHVTIQAINAMNAARRIFVPTKGAEKSDLAEVRREICGRYVKNSAVEIVEFEVPKRVTESKTYAGSVDDWHAAIARIYAALIDDLPNEASGAFLVWGDPSLYDSTIRIIERVRTSCADFDFSVIPGVTSIQALAASHRIPINLVGKPIEITTGRRLAGEGLKAESTVVMLDGEQAFAKLENPDAEIFWGAYLGTENEIIRAGRLGDIAEEIVSIRAEARKRHGWIMDIYLLRNGRDFEA